MADKNETGVDVTEQPDAVSVSREEPVETESEAEHDAEGTIGSEVGGEAAALEEETTPEASTDARDKSSDAHHAKVTAAAGTTSGLVNGLVRELRPKQWVKNVLVLAVPFLAGQIAVPSVLLEVALAFVTFSMAASGIYFINDLLDVESDRAHPTKRNRPIAAGLIPVPVAYAVAAVLLVGSVVVSALVTLPLAAVMVVYIAVQLGYCFGLKHQPVIDMCIVSSGFLLRIIAGGAAASLAISQWFMLVTAFGSLFMVAGKRYAEIILAQRTGAKIRKSLEAYSASYLRFVWAISAAIVIVTYSQWAYQQHEISSIWSTVSIVPFVIAILRYAVDVDRGTAGEPEEVVLNDKTLIVLGGALVVCLFMVFYGDGVVGTLLGLT